VSECQEKLYVYTRLPEYFDVHKVDERNRKLYSTNSGECIYPPNHMRTISEKMAIATLPRRATGEFYYKQTIQLPFKCDRTPVTIGSREGVQFKGYGEGAIMKELIVNLASVATPDLRTNVYRGTSCEVVSLSGRTQVPEVPPGLSVCSLRGSTGAARRVGPVINDSVHGNHTSRPPIPNVAVGTSGRGSGTPATQNRIFDFHQVLPTSVQQATPAYNQAVDKNFPTPPVRKSPPLPPPPPVVVQGGPSASTPVAECIVGTEITAQYPEAQVQYQEERGSSTPSMKCTSITKSVRGSTGRAVQVTQGQGSTPSVLECGTVPGTKRFNECASYSSSDDSTIATHDKYKVAGDTTGSTKSSSGSRHTGNTGRTSQKKRKIECGEALMLMKQKAEMKRVSTKQLREEVENVEFEESKYVGKTLGMNPEEWENDEPAEDTEELAGYRVEFL
jgi:hypothetical protein